MDGDSHKRLSQEEWEYVDLIHMTVGCITPALNGVWQDNAADVKRYLTKAMADGLDPERIYRAAIAPNSVITRRIPPWEKVKPTEM